MTPPDPIAHLLHGRALDNVLGVHEIDLSGFPGMVGKRVFNLVHNTARVRILCEDWGAEVLILDNGYMTSFLDNLALVAMAHGKEGEIPIPRSAPELAQALAKKFFAEQMLVLGNSRVGRVLFLETVIEYDEHLRSAFARKGVDEALDRSSDRFTAMAADFLRNHELGHVLTPHPSLRDYAATARREAARVAGWDALTDAGRTRIVEELSSDLFGINSVLLLYAGTMSGERLKNYLTFLVVAVTRMHVLYELAADSHRVNVDAAFDPGDLDGRFAEWRIREGAMVAYLADLAFDATTVSPACSDDLIPLDLERSGILELATTDYVAMTSESGRRIAELVAAGFEPGAGFEQVVAGTRQMRTLDRR